MTDPKRRFDIQYQRILADKLRNVPAWRDLALACNEVLGKEVDERRRKLEKIKDSVKYRRGDTLVNTAYEPDPARPALYSETEVADNIPAGTIIPLAKVKNVVSNIAYFKNPNSTDYLDLEFTYKNRVVRWLMPIQITQERDALLKNSYIMGFDFFNTKLNDEDLQRLYETVQMYWPESGKSDLFMRYIGYIKNANFNLIPLWSYEAVEDEYPVLEAKKDSNVSVKDGGVWYLTSHVEIRYDLAQFNQFYTLNLDDLEQLFYYFAPIILVLERIVGELNIETTVEASLTSGATLYDYDLWKPDFDIVTRTAHKVVSGATLYDYGVLAVTPN